MLTWQYLKDNFALTSPGQSQIHSELVQARCTEYKGKPLLLGGCAQLKGSRSDSIAAAQAIGAELDLTDKGLGIRSRRYTLLAEDGVVRFFVVAALPHHIASPESIIWASFCCYAVLLKVIGPSPCTCKDVSVLDAHSSMP